MLKRTTKIAGGLIVAMTALFFLADRPISELLGYFRASASTTVKAMEEEIPDVIHDEKTEAELSAARQQLVDRQVQLNLSQNQLKGLENEISTLRQSIDGRKDVLASAYPVLQNALDLQESQVMFVSTKFTLTDFQGEIDDLLALQDRDEHALNIKQQGYERLASSVADGEAALTEMKNRMLEVEQEFAVLKTRRDQARMESDTLDLVAGATNDRSSTSAHIGDSVDRLAGQVETLEARNAARRDVASVEQRVSTGRLTQSFNRLEALKKYAAAAKDQDLAEQTEPEHDTRQAENVKTKLSAKEVVIHIRGDQQPPTQDNE
jgi:hypothetical protein